MSKSGVITNQIKAIDGEIIRLMISDRFFISYARKPQAIKPGDECVLRRDMQKP